MCDTDDEERCEKEKNKKMSDYFHRCELHILLNSAGIVSNSTPSVYQCLPNPTLTPARG